MGAQHLARPCERYGATPRDRSAEGFEPLMTEDRDIVRGSLDTASDWRLTRPADLPGQSIGQAYYRYLSPDRVRIEWRQR